MIRSLIDRDLVYREGDRWKAREAVSDIDVPDTIQSVVLARVDRLQSEAKAVLQCASVIGRLFKYRLLRHLAHQEQDLDQYLNDLEDRELVYEERTVPGLEYAFKHAFTQEATYQGILERRRRDFHAKVAHGIERLYRERLEEYYEELAYHYAHSDDREKAVTYLVEAGLKASRQSACDAAIEHLQKGLEILADLPETPERIQQELDLQVALGSALISACGMAAPEVEVAYTRTHELCQQVGETPQLLPVLWGLMAFYVMRGEFQTAHQLSAELVALAQQADDPALLIMAHHGRGDTFLGLGEIVRAWEHHEQGIALCDPEEHGAPAFLYGGEDHGTSCHSAAAMELCLLGFPDRALVRKQQSLAMAHELRNPNNAAFARMGAIFFHQYRRESKAVQEQAEALVALATEHGYPDFVALATFMRGWALVDQGQVEEAMAVAGETGALGYDAELNRLKGDLVRQKAEGRGRSRGGSGSLFPTGHRSRPPSANEVI